MGDNASQPHGSFDEIREEVDGKPMRRLFEYATPYWTYLGAGTLAAIVNRGAPRPRPRHRHRHRPRHHRERRARPLRTGRLVTSHPAATDAAQLSLLTRLAAIAVGAYVIQSGSHYASRYLFQTTAQKVQHDLIRDTYDHMQRLSMDFFHDHQTGGMMSILASDINRLEDFFNAEIRQIVRAVVIFVLIGAFMLWKAPMLAPYVLLPVVAIALVTGRFITWIESKYKRIREQVARLNTRLANNLGGAAIIKSFDRYDVESDRVGERSEDYRDEKIAAITIRKAFFASLRLVVGGMFVAVLFLGGREVIVGVLSTGTFVACFMYLRYLDGPMTRIEKTVNNYQKAKSSAERVFGILESDPDIADREDAVTLDDVDGDVRFEDVTFSYDGDETILDGVTVDAAPGETVGLAGTSGSGKSTLLKLLPRFYNVDSGRDTVDGTDVRDVAVSSVIVLDEATSDVDTETEEIIQENLERHCADRTAFVIAHRLSTIQDADRIIIMGDGNVIERGTHDELVREEDGTYAQLWASQADMESGQTGVAD